MTTLDPSTYAAMQAFAQMYGGLPGGGVPPIPAPGAPLNVQTVANATPDISQPDGTTQTVTTPASAADHNMVAPLMLFGQQVQGGSADGRPAGQTTSGRGVEDLSGGPGASPIGGSPAAPGGPVAGVSPGYVDIGLGGRIGLGALDALGGPVGKGLSEVIGGAITANNTNANNEVLDKQGLSAFEHSPLGALAANTTIGQVANGLFGDGTIGNTGAARDAVARTDNQAMLDKAGRAQLMDNVASSALAAQAEANNTDARASGALDGNGSSPNSDTGQTSGGGVAGGDPGGAGGNAPDSAFAKGGLVRGPGTATSDSIPARLSNGEGVLPASAVNKLGLAEFDRLVHGDVSRAQLAAGIKHSSRGRRFGY